SVTYYVTRDGGRPAGGCPTSSTPAAVTSCTDSGLTAGSHDYTVTAKWRTWTATSGTTTIPVASGAPDHFVLAAASTTPASGAADDPPITAQGSRGNTAPAFPGPPHPTL